MKIAEIGLSQEELEFLQARRNQLQKEIEIEKSKSNKNTETIRRLYKSDTIIALWILEELFNTNPIKITR